MENSNQGSITFYPVAQFRRKAQGGLYMTYSGAGKLTFSQALGSELEERRIAFGEIDGKLCFVFVLGVERQGLLVRRRQCSDGVLRRHCKNLAPGTRIHFDFDPELSGYVVFIESRRERIDTGGASGTIGATRQPAELQP